MCDLVTSVDFPIIQFSSFLILNQYQLRNLEDFVELGDMDGKARRGHGSYTRRAFFVRTADTPPWRRAPAFRMAMAHYTPPVLRSLSAVRELGTNWGLA